MPPVATVIPVAAPTAAVASAPMAIGGHFQHAPENVGIIEVCDNVSPIQMLSPQAPGLRQSGSPENLPSYAFGSAKNTTASGSPVPICIGRRRWGGAIISASIYAEDRV